MAVKDRIEEFPHRYTLTNTSNSQVLGTFELTKDSGVVTEEGTTVNKDLLDSYLGAIGTTTGTGTTLVLADPNFLLSDGITIKFKLHVVSGASATINVNGTGAKSIITSKGKSMKAGLPIGVWITAIYSSTIDSFILQGEGGGELRYGNDVGQISTFELCMMGFNPEYGK